MRAPVRILFFGRLADLVDSAETSFNLDDQAKKSEISTEDLYSELANQNEKLPQRAQDPSIKVAVNQQLVSWDSRVKAGDEVAFLPPVTGG